MKGNVADDLVSRRHCSQHAASLWSQGAIKCALAFKRKISAHNNQQHGWKWLWKMAAVLRWHWEAALGVGVGKLHWAAVEDATVLLGGAGGRRTCNDGVGVSIIKA